jgi:hypothetical protein
MAHYTPIVEYPPHSGSLEDGTNLCPENLLPAKPTEQAYHGPKAHNVNIRWQWLS